MPLVSIIVVNWNGRCWLESCLPTLQAQTYRDFEIIVMDNGSSDDSVSWLEENWPDVILLRAEHNLGFAPANNIAIRAAKGQYIVTLNNDTLADPNWLAELVQTADDTGAGMVASCILNWQQPDVLDSVGIEVDWAGIAWQRGWGQSVDTAVIPQIIFGPSGAAALYRREMLDEIGLFDEDFASYYEDVDLAWRANRAGWRCHYTPKAQVCHWHSATAQKIPERKQFLLGRNKIWTIAKNYQWPNILWSLPLIILFDGSAILYQTIKTRSLASINGRIAALKSLPVMWAKRTLVQHPVPLTPPTLHIKFPK